MIKSSNIYRYKPKEHSESKILKIKYNKTYFENRVGPGVLHSDTQQTSVLQDAKQLRQNQNTLSGLSCVLLGAFFATFFFRATTVQLSNHQTLQLSFPFPKEWVYHTEGFVGSNLKTRLSRQVANENTSERESSQSLRSLPASEAEVFEGLLNLPFLEDRTKKIRILKSTKNRRQPNENKRCQNNTALCVLQERKFVEHWA